VIWGTYKSQHRSTHTDGRRLVSLRSQSTGVVEHSDDLDQGFGNRDGRSQTVAGTSGVVGLKRGRG
jgi:hypothetical protein